MNTRQSLKTGAEVIDEVSGRTGTTQGVACQSLYICESIFYPVIEFLDKQLLGLLGDLPLADIDEHVDRSNHLARMWVPQGSRMWDERSARPIGSLKYRLHPLIGLCSFSAMAMGQSSCGRGVPSG